MVNINKFSTKLAIFFAGIFMLVFAGCMNLDTLNEEKVACTMDVKLCDDGTYVGRTGKSCEFICPNSNETGLKKFSSSDEIKDYLSKTQSNSNLGYGGNLGMVKTLGARNEMALSADSSQSSGAPSSGGSNSAQDYSTTNNQVEGVDEADIVKNDGEYIYGITGSKLYIMKAFPSEDAKIVYETKIDGYYGQEIFVNGNKLVLFTNSYKEVQIISKYDFMPRPTQKEVTNITIYDITNRAKPKIIESYELSGNYYDSRMIGNQVYVISNEYTYYGDNIPMPYVRSANTKISPEVYYFDMPQSSYSFNTIASFNLEDLSKGVNAKSYMLGSASTLYVSQNNIYIVYQNYNRYWFGWGGGNYEIEQKNKFFEVVVPLLPQDTRNKIEKIGKDGSWDEISSVLEDMYNLMSESAKKDLITKIEKAIEEYDVKKEEERSKTYIHKIAIKDGNIDYVAKGEVKGNLLNQFSLDENSDGFLRVATNFNIWTQKGSVMYNNVYILDKEMKQVGVLEKIAADERIYSTRFMKDKLFMVTFKQIDPLFVINLSDNTKPEILGYLKIPGFSSYLQMYDETHLIGIGKDTYTQKEITRTKGVKISMFDISDFENPKEVDNVVIGDEGSYSAAENDHKALLLSKSKNLLVLPVNEVTQSYEKDKYGYLRNTIWQGAYVYSVSEKGFEEKGKITHDNSQTLNTDNYYYPDYNSNIQRSLFMDDNLYTISNKKILINSLDNLKEINDIKLPYEEKVYETPIYYAEDSVSVESSN